MNKHPWKRNNDKYIKLTQLSGYISAKYDYHHGEERLQGAIVMLAQNFPGSNNCNLLVPKGQFGKRDNPQGVSAYRYLHTAGSQWLSVLYKKDDELLYKYRLSDNGEDIEPERLYPIIPIQMVNGAQGTATGWSTFMPCYDVKDVINYIIEFLTKGSYD